MAKKIIVIGSGFGGLAASLRLKAKGYKVTLVEKHPDLGGRARVFKKGDFIYDGGPTVITAPYLFEELFSMFNKKISDYVKIVPLDLWYRFVFSDGDTFDYNGNDKSMEEQVKKFNSGDYNGYKKLVNFTEKIFDKGFTDLSDRPFNNLVFMMKQIPSLLKLKSYKSVYSLVSNYITDEKLRFLTSANLDVEVFSSSSDDCNIFDDITAIIDKITSEIKISINVNPLFIKYKTFCCICVLIFILKPY